MSPLLRTRTGLPLTVNDVDISSPSTEPMLKHPTLKPAIQLAVSTPERRA
ncbi:MAG: hypothetical protein ACK44A_10075 [Roseateles sp.]